MSDAILKKEFNVVKDWTTKAGYRAVIIFGDMGHHCGYVGIPKEHPLYGKAYNEDIPTPEWLKEVSIGKRGAIDIFIQALREDQSICDVGLLFDVHGGITYSGCSDDYPVEAKGLWWFGYDCAHYNDKTSYSSSGIFRDADYCEKECESLAEQLKDVNNKLSNQNQKTV